MTATTSSSSAAAAVGATDYSVGTSIPPATAHAVSVSLPRWQDNVDYEEGRLTDVMETGYPRFFIHKNVQRLASMCLRKFGQASVAWYPPGQKDEGSGGGGIVKVRAEAESCLLVPSVNVANRCRAFMQRQHALQHKQAGTTAPAPLSVRIVHFDLVAREESPAEVLSIYIVLFPAPAFPLAKSFWQHTGDGISSRRAETALKLLEQTGKLEATAAEAEKPPPPRAPQPDERSYSRNRHYARAKTTMMMPSSSSSSSSSLSNGLPAGSSTPVALSTSSSSASLLRNAGDSSSSPSITSPSMNHSEHGEEAVDKLCSDHATYVEERYGRNMPRAQAPKAKLALRRRIAGVASGEGAQRHERSAAPRLSEDDVFLFPSGMSSIFHAHQAAMRWQRRRRQPPTTGHDDGNDDDDDDDVGQAVCFGFPYTDTLKILQKWGPGCWFYGNGTDSDLDQFEARLASSPPGSVLALFCEFPSNPLLRTPDLARIRTLADTHGFLIVVDETIGNFVNVEVLHFADIVVSSMTKIFSGETNCMGGSMVLNPRGSHYADLHAVLKDEYEDNYFGDDAVFMERNSRSFVDRVAKIDINAEALVDLLWKEKERGSSVVKGVFYPKYVTRQHYDACRRPNGGFGGLFSLTFQSTAAATAFYDALKCAKGPSLGTNFTLASPYCILAHYGELDWAARFGVESNLVRISVGLEETGALLTMFSTALEKARVATS
ncbi:PLP-dependent transferase [Acaromyces ingoldii]|uniref:cystathionine gamma-synthase n=1 Tax=Acaromyces ingoldii TaxID=215250 RepID=A0A316YMS6_9BASI|nr:PLP-dependent transferase [Acaromyces ingoldii]PWN89968.1 PLP-dependent transferase [Acaromyces ingoldii]